MFKRLSHDRRILLLVLCSGMPALLVALVLVGRTEFIPAGKWGLSMLMVGSWVAFALLARDRVKRPLQTLSNLLLAIREEDFSIRASGARFGDPLGEVFMELNALRQLLREQRLGALEATALLRTVMEEISLAVFAFDEQQRLCLGNRAGERLLAQPVERLIGRTAQELGLAECLAGEPARTLEAAFPSGVGRWGMRRGMFRQGGRRHYLLVLADLSEALREEERQAWQRLVRVLGHELNNSLAPIKSISASLVQLMAKDPLPGDWKEDMQQGLEVISGRAEALNRFMENYSRLARLPAPTRQSVELAPLVRRVAGLETRLQIQIIPGPELTLAADPDQLEQLLINLARNAVDAARETKGKVCMTWAKAGTQLEIRIEDEGLGVPNSANLFVPFYTTKRGGSGIGLVLSRQIAEAHGGTLTLQNRSDRNGCIARLRLPLA